MIRRGLAVLGMLAFLTLLTLSTPAQQPAKGKKYALLVGVSDYKHANLPALKYTGNDVEALAEVLSSKDGGFHSVRVLTTARGQKNPKTDRPGKINIERELTTILANKGRDDTVLIALSGHGVQLEVEDPDGKGPSKSYSYFCPFNADFVKVSYSTGKAPNLILLDEIIKRLGECGAGTRLIFIDACRNEIKADSTTRAPDIQKLTIPVGVAAMYSCKSGERAWETSKLGKGHGVFFYHVIEGFKGKGANDKGDVRWSRLTEYVTDSVVEDVPKLIGAGSRQTPHAASNLVGGGPVLARAAGNPGKVPVVKVDAKDAEQLYQRGKALMWGAKEQKIHYREAAEHFKKAADLKHPIACAARARVLARGEGVARDPATSLSLAREAIALGLEKLAETNTDAMMEYAYMLRDGRGVKADRSKAAELYRKAADKGDIEGKMAVSEDYLYGQSKNEKEGIKLRKELANKGYASAQYVLSHCYLNGRLVEMDEKEGKRLMQAAADQGYPTALTMLGTQLVNGKGDAKEQARGVELLKQAADQNSYQAMSTLGTAYLYGRGVPKDEKQAREWLEKAAPFSATARDALKRLDKK